jgi:hypothetical protein
LSVKQVESIIRCHRNLFGTDALGFRLAESGDERLAHAPLQLSPGE